MKTSLINRIRQIAMKILGAFSFMLIFTTQIYGQPGFPVSPSQAPIDGGLGLLAAAGGAYALKKLRDKKAE